MAGAVDRLARLTGSDPVPPHKQAMGYSHCGDKFGAAGVTAQGSEVVRPSRVLECPVQLEAVLETSHRFGRRPDRETTACAFEVRVVRAHVDESILAAGKENHIDPDAVAAADYELLPDVRAGSACRGVAARGDSRSRCIVRRRGCSAERTARGEFCERTQEKGGALESCRPSCSV